MAYEIYTRTKVKLEEAIEESKKLEKGLLLLLLRLGDLQQIMSIWVIFQSNMRRMLLSLMK